jgi:hypothetical protein
MIQAGETDFGGRGNITNACPIVTLLGKHLRRRAQDGCQLDVELSALPNDVRPPRVDEIRSFVG